MLYEVHFQSASSLDAWVFDQGSESGCCAGSGGSCCSLGLGIAHLFSVVLMYEGFFVTFLGALQVLASYVSRERALGEEKENVVYHKGFHPVWFDFRRFAELAPDERRLYRQEGIVLAIVGLGLLVGVVVLRFIVG